MEHFSVHRINEKWISSPFSELPLAWKNEIKEIVQVTTQDLTLIKNIKRYHDNPTQLNKK